MTFEEYKKQFYKTKRVWGYDEWYKATFDLNGNGTIDSGKESKNLREHNPTTEYAAYVATVETENNQRLARLLAEWKASQNPDAVTVSTGAQSAKQQLENKVAEMKNAETMQKEANSPKKIAIIGAALAAILIFKK